MSTSDAVIKEHVIVDCHGCYVKDYKWGDGFFMPNGCHRAAVNPDEFILLKSGRAKVVVFGDFAVTEPIN